MAFSFFTKSAIETLNKLYWIPDYIICNDLRKSKTINYLITLINNCNKLKIKNLILPMYGKSKLSVKNYLSYAESINQITKIARIEKIPINLIKYI